VKISSELTVNCHQCDGDGVIGSGGPGAHRCNHCFGGQVPQQWLSVHSVIEALEANLNYTPSGNHVIREVAKALGFKLEGEAESPTENERLRAQITVLDPCRKALQRLERSSEIGEHDRHIEALDALADYDEWKAKQETT